MRDDLTDAEIDEVLRQQLYGHLGCMLPDSRVYVVPITYAYQDNAIYSFSLHGLKIDALRKNPSACFQTEQFLRDGAWRSVHLRGTYEELSDGEKLTAAKALFRRLGSEGGIAISPLYQPPPMLLLPSVMQATKDKEAIFYRIRIDEKTGKIMREL